MDKKIALVTGASRGIGAAIAMRLAQDGFYVIGTATTKSGSENISTRLGQNGCGRILDVQHTESITSLMNQIEQEFGIVSVLVNNAGSTKDGLLMRMSQDDWQNVLNIHLNAVFSLSKCAVKGMMKARYGRIINITSVVAQMGNAGQTNYVAAKAGIEGFSRALACEIGSRNITVNCIAPGFIATDMTEQLTDEQKQKMLQLVPLQRLGQPEDIANAVSFIASEQAGYITGTVLAVNGGMFLG